MRPLIEQTAYFWRAALARVSSSSFPLSVLRAIDPFGNSAMSRSLSPSGIGSE
jgi:hypothetical protein